MGCCSSSPPLGFNADAEEIRAAKLFFRVQDLPVSLKATRTPSCMQVCVVGLDQTGILAALELGFQRRRFWIADATSISRQGFFTGTFDLQPFDTEEEVPNVSEDMCDPETIQDVCNQVNVTPLKAPLDVGSMKTTQFQSLLDLQTPTMRPGKPQVDGDSAAFESLDVHTPVSPPRTKNMLHSPSNATSDGATVRLTIVREWCPGLRVALLHAMHSVGLRIILARLSISKSRKKRTVKDSFWLAENREGGERSLQGDPWAVQDENRPQWLSELQHKLLQVQPEMLSPMRSPMRKQISLTKEKQSEQERCAELPEILKKVARGLPYHLHANSELGLQFDNLSKFCGVGMNKNIDSKDVLEFSTYFVAKDDANNSQAKRNSRFLSGRKKYAEFITQYLPPLRRLSFFKLFLNDVIPSGKRAGARAVSEHLLRMSVPTTTFASWDSSEVIRGLNEIHLCDVVNWNTYSILSKVGQVPESDVEQWLLKQELQHAGLTLDDLKSKPVEKIFPKTVLGKLVNAVLQEWSAEGMASLAIKCVDVHLNHKCQEIICGEARSIMDVVVHLDNSYSSCGNLEKAPTSQANPELEKPSGESGSLETSPHNLVGPSSPQEPVAATFAHDSSSPHEYPLTSTTIGRNTTTI